MRDFIEMAEDAAEKQLDDATQPDGKIKCACGNLFDLSDGHPASANPYAMPICETCFNNWLSTIENKE